MIRLLHAEWIKLRTVTMNWVLTTIALAFPLVVTLLTAFFRGDDSDFSTRQLVEVATGSSFVTVLLLGVVAAAGITGEFGFGTIRPTFAATPRRPRVMVAKGVVAVVLAVVVQAVVVLVAVGVGGVISDARGYTTNLGDVPTAVPALTGAVALAGLMALAGFGLGMVVRSTPAAVAVLILWPLMAEALVGGLLGLLLDSENVANWLPFRAGFNLPAVEVFGDGPSRLVSGLYFGGVALALALLGGWLVNRRDA